MLTRLSHTSAHSWSSSYGWQGCWEKPVEENLTKLLLSVRRARTWGGEGHVLRVVESQPIVMRIHQSIETMHWFLCIKDFPLCSIRCSFLPRWKQQETFCCLLVLQLWCDCHTHPFTVFLGHKLEDTQIPRSQLWPRIAHLTSLNPEFYCPFPHFTWPVPFLTNQDLPQYTLYTIWYSLC